MPSEPIIREWLVERAILGELPEGVELTEAERRRKDELQAQDAGILRSYPASVVAARVRARLDEASTPPAVPLWRVALPVLGPLSALAVALLVVGLPESTLDRPLSSKHQPETTRIKGSGLVVVRKTDAGTEALRPGDDVAQGTQLQLAVRLVGPAHAVVVSVDGRGIVTPHLPDRADGPAPFLEEELLRLPHSYELDDAPAFERFILVSSAEPFESALVIDAAEQLAVDPAGAREGQLVLPDSFTQQDFLLRKVSTP
ncbi:MAG: hypothetical protein AAGD10_14545 [Myxococcota bacterium]